MTSDEFWLQAKRGDEVIIEIGNPQLAPKERFWIVLRDPAHPNATARHRTFDDAQAEANRLCLKFNAPFYVFQVVSEGKVEPQVPLWTRT